ncbi:MAG: GNAT family N-acetyltransferase [Chloroflexi bacterium]|nr:GNAT family N-acetyltransferase [Chloroflexota bacterium]
MNIEIRKLTSDLAMDYVHFFDTTPHSDNIEDHKCYCVCWCNDDYEGKDFSTPDKRRDYAIQYVKGNNIQGYLAYRDDEVVGWCNANTKSDCLKCCSWQMFMGSIPTDETIPGVKVKSIFCFAIAPEMKRKGIAKRFLERVCQDAARDGFDFVEAYPNKEFIDEAEDFMGPVKLFIKSGFSVYYETEHKFVMRKQLK